MDLPHNPRIRLGSEVLDLKVSAIGGGDGRYLGPMLTRALVTKEAKAERRIRQFAHVDTLIGVANRVSIQNHLQQRLGRAENVFEPATSI